MKPEERNAPEADWRTADSHLAALEQRRSQEASYLEGYGLSPFAEDSPAAPLRDEWREAARDRLREEVARRDPLAEVESRRAHDAFEEKRRSAELACRLADRAGEEVDPDIRRLASSRSAQLSVDALVAARAQDFEIRRRLATDLLRATG